MKTVVIVQARLNSTRLPRKVVLELGGKSILNHVLERCKLIRGVDTICCAIAQTTGSEQIEEIARTSGVNVSYGSENDVLSRYYNAAVEYKADIIMRITSDCPVIDPEVCSQLLELQQRSGADYACNNRPPSWPHGLDCEVFTFKWLELAEKNALKPSEREHVTPYIRNHSQSKKVDLKCPVEGLEKQRWTLDSYDDYQFFKALLQHSPNSVIPLGWESILTIVRTYPELTTINACHNRNEGLERSLQEDIKAGH